MNEPGTNTHTRDGIALILAALRQDTTALALLIAEMDVQAARDAAVFCSLIAADQFHARDRARATPGHYTSVLQHLALELAAAHGGTPAGP